MNYVRELPQGMQSTFIRAAGKLDEKTTSYKIDQNWEMYRCPESQHYYAVQTDAASTIIANTACIRKAYRIDPKTGNYLSEKLTDEGEEEHFIFVVKKFSGAQWKNEAIIEQETLSLHQFAEPLFEVEENKEKKAVVISIFYPGFSLTNSDDAPRPEFIKQLTFLQRVDLCYQLAKQYRNLHHTHKKLHIDVKGQNVMVYQLGDGRWRARLIDFGSVINCGDDPKKPIEASIKGMTQFAIPPEVIFKMLQRPNFPAHLFSGTVSEKSDMYGFAAIVMSLLGANNPYEDRSHIAQKSPPGFYDSEALINIVDRKFKTDGLFQNAKLNYHFSGEVNCQFKRVHGLALKPEKVLETQSEHETCYLAYDNYLLFKDGNRLYGYERPLRNIEKVVGHLTDNQLLHVDELAKLDDLSGFKREKKGRSLQTILQQHISQFIDSMQAPEPDQRPGSEAVLDFFKTVYAMCHLSEHEYDIFDDSKINKSSFEIENILELGLQYIASPNSGSISQIISEPPQSLSNMGIFNQESDETNDSSQPKCAQDLSSH